MKLSAAALKMIAIITMLIDHVTAVIVGDGMLGYRKLFTAFTKSNYQFVYDLYWTGRAIGRIAYPIFAFFIVEGFLHTKSKLKYAIRLFVFALISEIPFDMAFNGGSLEITSQNVYFNLLIGLLAIWAIDELMKTKWNTILKYALAIVIVATCSFVAEAVLACDYGYIGIFAIVLMYLFKKLGNVVAFGSGVIVLSIFNPFEAYALIDVLFIKLYDGTRGKQNKYLFYLFYPVHLFILGLIFNLMIVG